jgi:anti-sigma factor RsiW
VVHHDLTPEERRMVEDHLESCARCRESLEAFTAMEGSLISLKLTRSSWKAAEATFMRNAGFDRRRSIASLVLSGPILTGLAFIALGITCFFRRDAVLAMLRFFGDRSAVSVSALDRLLARLLDSFASVDQVILISIYGLLLISLLGATRILAMRFGRK